MCIPHADVFILDLRTLFSYAACDALLPSIGITLLKGIPRKLPLRTWLTLR